MRFRNIYMAIGGLLVIMIMLGTDPDTGWFHSLPFGASTIATLVILLQSVLYVGLLHYSRKALFDYLDFEEIAQRAMRSPEGAGQLAIAIAIAMVAIAVVIVAAVR